MLAKAGKSNEVEVKKKVRNFRFGDGATLRSSMEVTLPVEISGSKKKIKVSVIPGQTPMLLARPVLEEWGVIQDYAHDRIKRQDQWLVPNRRKNGH